MTMEMEWDPYRSIDVHDEALAGSERRLGWRGVDEGILRCGERREQGPRKEENGGSQHDLGLAVEVQLARMSCVRFILPLHVYIYMYLQTPRRQNLDMSGGDLWPAWTGRSQTGAAILRK